VATVAIGKAGAINAALLAAAIIAIHDPQTAQALDTYRSRQTERVLAQPNPGSAD
jgi:5-(carboxyamino)imidazole ribonucleotide mutase